MGTAHVFDKRDGVCSRCGLQGEHGGKEETEPEGNLRDESKKEATADPTYQLFDLGMLFDELDANTDGALTFSEIKNGLERN